MQREIKSLADLEHVDHGVVNRCFQESLMAAMDDLKDRPSVNRPRTVTVVMSMTPSASDSGELSGIETEFEIYLKVPKSRTRVISMAAKNKGGLLHNDFAAENVNQRTMDADFDRKDQE